jgi:hypothetical protein
MIKCPLTVRLDGRRMLFLLFKNAVSMFLSCFLKDIFCYLLILGNRLAIHAKRQTIMDKDIKLLRSFWQRINPESSIGANDGDLARQRH